MCSREDEAARRVLVWGLMMVACLVAGVGLIEHYQRRARAREMDFQHGEAAARAIYHLALDDLTEEQRDAFERRLEAVSTESDGAQWQYVEIASDITQVAVYGITDDDPIETLMDKANEKMLDAKVERRRTLILELKDRAQSALDARQRAIWISGRKDEREQAQRDFERSKKLLEAMLMKYSDLYPPAPTH